MNAKEIKIGMFGGGGVGKTAITLQFLKGEFTEGYIPTIEDQFTKVIDVDNQAISLMIIDTAGQDDFAEMRFSYYSQVQGCVLVFDISNPGSIDELKRMYNDISDAVDEPYFVIAANKADLRDESRSDLVPVEEYKKLEIELKCKVFETSAKTGSNIEKLYIQIIQDILSPKNTKPTEKKESKKSKNNNDEGGSGGCCNIA